jgi:hypothetical protein
MPIGTFTKKIHRQPIVEVMSPPRTSPPSAPATIEIWFTPSAFPRSPGGKASVRMAAEFEKRKAAPIACTSRNPMSSGPVCENPQRKEPTVKTANPRT